MKTVSIASDLHLEFGYVPPAEGGNVLILAGDICVARDFVIRVGGGYYNKRGKRYHNFFHDVSERFEHVLYIPGNHEHYNGDVSTTMDILRRSLAEFKNVRVMDAESVEIDGTVFVGATLWTDMNKEDYFTMSQIRGLMNDFQIINNKGATFRPEDAVMIHKHHHAVIRKALFENQDKEVIVFTHHGPTHKSVHQRYANQGLMNGGYISDLSDTILDNPNIRYWFHGHTHTKFDYMVGSTRVICNPRGYEGYDYGLSSGFEYGSYPFADK